MILDQVRDIDVGKKSVTLSIGVGQDAGNWLLSSSSLCPERRLAVERSGRGKAGYQALFLWRRVRVAKRTKVKSVIANALRELIEQSEVFIMSHAEPDLDSIGFALGIYRCVKFAGRTLIVLDNPMCQWTV